MAVGNARQGVRDPIHSQGEDHEPVETRLLQSRSLCFFHSHARRDAAAQEPRALSDRGRSYRPTCRRHSGKRTPISGPIRGLR